MPRVMNFNMITLKNVENFVNKFPELELINKDDCYGKTHHHCVMKESPDFEVFEYDNKNIFLNLDMPLRINAKDGRMYRLQDNVPYGLNYDDLNEMEKPLKKVVFMLDNIILLQKKMKMYEKKLDLENDFNE